MDGASAAKCLCMNSNKILECISETLRVQSCFDNTTNLLKHPIGNTAPTY